MSRLSDSPRAVNPTNTYVPLAAVLGAAIMAGSAVLWYQTDRGQLDKRIDQIANNVEKVNSTVSTLADAISKGRESGLSHQDLMLWCLRAERRNQGFQCPDEVPVPQLTGWFTSPVIVEKRR